MKKQNSNDGMEFTRISGRCRLTKEAIDTLNNSKNKSAFLSEAINFYVSFGRDINEHLKEISKKIDSIQHLKVVMDKAETLPELKVDNQQQEITEDKAIETEEERRQREQNEAMLSNFLNFSFSGGDE